MNILLFITNINNTIDNLTKNEFDTIINKIITIKEKEKYDILLISFIDETTNRNVILKYIRWLNKKVYDGKLFLGKQFLGDLYYKNIFETGILYDKDFNKKEIIENYINELENGNNVHTIILNKNLNDSMINKELKLKKDLTN